MRRDQQTETEKEKEEPPGKDFANGLQNPNVRDRLNIIMKHQMRPTLKQQSFPLALSCFDL